MTGIVSFFRFNVLENEKEWIMNKEEEIKKQKIKFIKEINLNNLNSKNENDLSTDFLTD